MHFDFGLRYAIPVFHRGVWVGSIQILLAKGLVPRGVVGSGRSQRLFVGRAGDCLLVRSGEFGRFSRFSGLTYKGHGRSSRRPSCRSLSPLPFQKRSLPTCQVHSESNVN